MGKIRNVNILEISKKMSKLVAQGGLKNDTTARLSGHALVLIVYKYHYQINEINNILDKNNLLKNPFPCCAKHS